MNEMHHEAVTEPHLAHGPPVELANYCHVAQANTVTSWQTAGGLLALQSYVKSPNLFIFVVILSHD